MKRTARLTLKKETLAALCADELSGVVGAASAGPTCYTCTCRSCLECLVGPTLPDAGCVPNITLGTFC